VSFRNLIFQAEVVEQRFAVPREESEDSKIFFRLKDGAKLLVGAF
jgi:hypothetical protein